VKRETSVSLSAQENAPIASFLLVTQDHSYAVCNRNGIFSVQSSESGEGKSPILQRKMHLVDKFFVGDGASFLTGTLDLDS
jgi:hypothetical protein